MNFTKQLSFCYSKRFKCFTSVYTFEHDNDINNNNEPQQQQQQYGLGILEQFDNLQDRVEQVVKIIQNEFTNPSTHVRLTINTDGLEGSVHIPYYKVTKLNSEKIFNTVKTVLQSSKVLPLNKWYITINSVDASSSSSSSSSSSQQQQASSSTNNFDSNLYYGNAKRRWLTEPIYDWLISSESNGARNRNVIEVGGDDDNLCLIKVCYT